jgi:hypothetical protein
MCELPAPLLQGPTGCHGPQMKASRTQTRILSCQGDAPIREGRALLLRKLNGIELAAVRAHIDDAVNYCRRGLYAAYLVGPFLAA